MILPTVYRQDFYSFFFRHVDRTLVYPQLRIVMDGAIPIEVSVLCVLRREENSPYRLLLVV
jgi:hypothetical protein